MQKVNRNKEIGYDPIKLGKHQDEVRLEIIKDNEDRQIYLLSVPADYTNEILFIKFKLKALGVKGSWASNAILDKRFRTDWEMPQLESSISVNAPLINLFGYDDENIITIACSDAINNIQFELGLREEDNHFYCSLHFFSSAFRKGDYSTMILVDKSVLNFSEIIQKTANWILRQSKMKIEPIPKLAKAPLYSTWYSFHQNLDEKVLLEECHLAKSLGYDLIIIDDGWQTMDDGRGYDYTGDWQAERFKDVKAFVKDVHAIGMAIMFWYSVPFCGVKSKAYQKFKGKFLTENHYWAPVFDPRFPEVRSYLVGIYKTALREWKIDGFKLDFIDDFKVYPETEMHKLDGRDTLSISAGTEKLITEISEELRAIKPDVLIEFRQKYISPALHKLGNMFRAFDCPNDSLMNRVRTTDVKLICGNSAVHSDMITWHEEEPIEVAALQFTSLIFSVPQLSIRINNRSQEEREMIKFYTNYWREHKYILLDGIFRAYKPLANYPYLSATDGEVMIYGLYDDVILPVDLNFKIIHLINGKTSNSVVIRFDGKTSIWKKNVVNCKGIEQSSDNIELRAGLMEFICPPNGIVFLKN